MLKIYFGDMGEGAVYNNRVYFDNTYELNWINSRLAKKIIKDRGQYKIVFRKYVWDKNLGGIIPYEYFSNEIKTLLLMINEPEKVFNASMCSDECAKWILKIAKKQDLTINLRHFMDFGDEPFEILVLNNNKIAQNTLELLNYADGNI